MSVCSNTNGVWRKDILSAIVIVLCIFPPHCFFHLCLSLSLSLSHLHLFPYVSCRYSFSFSFPQNLFPEMKTEILWIFIAHVMLKNCKQLSFVCLFFVTGISVKVYSSFKLHLSCLLFLVTLSLWRWEDVKRREEREDLLVSVTPEGVLHRMQINPAAPRVFLL